MRTVDNARVGIWQFPAALGRIREQHADATIDVDQGVPPGRSRAIAHHIEFLFCVGQRRTECLENERALVESQVAEGTLTHCAGIVNCAREVEAITPNERKNLARRRVPDWRAGLGLPPFALHITG